MAVSELEIEPDLNKAPPHVEGDLLKQNTKKAVISKWRKYFFVVNKDKLRYFTKKEDYQSSKSPVHEIRLARVTDISESVFNKVPRKTHLNSGFSVTEITSQGEQVYNLLAESPDMMRYWVHALRYVKAYWSKKQVRDTVINEEIERKLLEQILKEEDDEDDDNDFVGEYSILDGQDLENKSLSITVTFADTSKVTCKMSAMDKISDLFDKISDRMTSSAAQIWIIDNHGKEYLTHFSDSLDMYSSGQQFFAVDPTDRVIVVFIDDSDDFVATIFPFKITAQEVIEDVAIAPKLDIAGIANRGLFLKKQQLAELFQATECPCDALFTEKNGKIQRIQDAGRLIIKNKALDRGRPSTWRHTKSIRSQEVGKKGSNVLQSELEEEAQQRAILHAHQKRRANAQRSYRPIPQVTEETTDQKDPGKTYTPPTSRRNVDVPEKINRSRTEVLRDRSKAFVQATLDFPQPPPMRSQYSPSRTLDDEKTKPESDSKNPIFMVEDLSADNPATISDDDPLAHTSSDEGSPLVRKKVLRSRRGRLSPSVMGSSMSMKKRTESILADLSADDSRSSTFAISSAISIKHPQTSEIEEDKLEQLFSSSFQEREEQERIRVELEKQSSVTETIQQNAKVKVSLAEGSPDQVDSDEEDEAELSMNPMVIEFDSLRKGEEGGKMAAAPIVIHRPSILKVILMQSQVMNSPSHKQSGMDLISLSGVVLRRKNRLWELHDGSAFHDLKSAEEDKESKTEKFSLPGGILAVFNYNSERWYVLPSLTPNPHRPVPSESQVQSNAEYDADTEALRVFAQHQYLQKRAIVTEIGSSFNEILEQFKNCKSSEEKKKIASDMANDTIGHMVRGRFCTAIAALLLDGLKAQKLGFVQQDAWKVVNAFCQEGYNLYSLSASNIYATIESRVLRPIKGEGRLTNNHMRFRAFVCLCISRGVFLQWLTDLPLLKDTIKRYYLPDSLLYLASIAGNPSFDKLYEEIILSLQPLPFIPFQLSLSFEVQTPSELFVSMAGSHSRSTSPVPSPLHSSSLTQNQLKESHSKSVMESTGQRTNEATSITSLVNESFTEEPPLPRKPQMSQSAKLLDSLKVDNINKSSGPSWLKKLSEGISNLNIGGAITGSPVTSSVTEQSTFVPNPTNESTNESYVEALFDNQDVESKELRFRKGDLLKVKESVDENWLLCVKDNDSGIVPVNYVKTVQ